MTADKRDGMTIVDPGVRVLGSGTFAFVVPGLLAAVSSIHLCALAAEIEGARSYRARADDGLCKGRMVCIGGLVRERVRCRRAGLATGSETSSGGREGEGGLAGKCRSGMFVRRTGRDSESGEGDGGGLWLLRARWEGVDHESRTWDYAGGEAG